MPLRDHFRPPLSNKSSWDELHGGWPMAIVQQLRSLLPPGFTAAPQVHLGAPVVVDVAAFEQYDRPYSVDTGAGGVATAAWAPAKVNLAVETELPEQDEYEVRVYDAERGRHLVAVIEIVSPGNKDRDSNRNAFLGKCAALLRKEVAVSIVDLVTARRGNLYADLLAFIGQRDPTLPDPPPSIYAATCRWLKGKKGAKLEAWSNELKVGEPLPTLPLWLTPDLAIPLDLEPAYEKACYDVWIS